jgi:hypothetical protein
MSPLSFNQFYADRAAVRALAARNAHTVSALASRDALDSLLASFLEDVSPQVAANILADAVGKLVSTGKWSEADARTVLYTADRRIDQVVS